MTLRANIRLQQTLTRSNTSLFCSIVIDDEEVFTTSTPRLADVDVPVVESVRLHPEVVLDGDDTTPEKDPNKLKFLSGPEANVKLFTAVSYDLLKVCYVPVTCASLPRLLFLLQPLTVLMKQTRRAVCAIKQYILLRCL